jgi:hypothetical protein
MARVCSGTVPLRKKRAEIGKMRISSVPEKQSMAGNFAFLFFLNQPRTTAPASSALP